MHSVIILGTGNASQQLCEAFSKTDSVQLVQVFGRNPNHLAKFRTYSEICSNSNEIADSDVYIIAVKDDAIAQVSQLLKSKKGVVAHTSGATEMDCIQAENRGVFYPLQTFTTDKMLDFNPIPICIEANKNDGLRILKTLANTISKNVHEITSEQRKKMHLAAVFANNFTNYLYGIAEEICQNEGLSFNLLKPLISETSEKIQQMSAIQAQTGPARRGDEKSMDNHLKMLTHHQHKELYLLISKAIKSRYEEKL